MPEIKKDEAKKEVNNYLRYSGLGFQIAGSIVMGALIGYGLDKWFKTKQPYFLLACCLIFLAGGMYIAFRDLLKNK